MENRRRRQADSDSDTTSNSPQVYIEDKDVHCMAKSAHVKRFDRTEFRNYWPGEYVLYRNTFYKVGVTVNCESCPVSSARLCAVKVYSQNTTVEFDKCGNLGQASDNDAQITISGDQSPHDLLVKHHTDRQIYFVMLPTGTRVTIADHEHLAVNISASTIDYGKTEGLCGLLDSDNFTDLILASEMHQDVSAPEGFILEWHVDNAGDSPDTGVTPSCSCLDSYSSDDACTNFSRVVTCDFVQGEDITELLINATKSMENRRRRQADSDIDTTSNSPQAKKSGKQKPGVTVM